MYCVIYFPSDWSAEQCGLYMDDHFCERNDQSFYHRGKWFVYISNVGMLNALVEGSDS